MKPMRLVFVMILALLTVTGPRLGAQAPKVTAPAQEWGNEIGADLRKNSNGREKRAQADTMPV